MIHHSPPDTSPARELNAERTRLAEAYKNTQPWYYWGPYLSDSGGQFARTIHPLVMPATSSHMITLVPAPTAGAKMAC
jgi:hypothetical protein